MAWFLQVGAGRHIVEIAIRVRTSVLGVVRRGAAAGASLAAERTVRCCRGTGLQRGTRSPRLGMALVGGWWDAPRGLLVHFCTEFPTTPPRAPKPVDLLDVVENMPTDGSQ